MVIEPLPHDIVRVLIQALKEAGCEGAAHELAAETGGTALESQPADVLRTMVEASEPMESIVAHFDACVAHLLEASAERKMRLALERCRFAELVRTGQRADALLCLQGRITPLAPDAETLRSLAACLFGSGPDVSLSLVTAVGSPRNARQDLVEELHATLPTRMLLPRSRLRTLLAQAQAHQIEKCSVHIAPEAHPDSKTWPACGITEDHACDISSMTLETVHVLRRHGEEVWHAAFSPDGGLLATAGSSGTVCVWRVASGALVAEVVVRASVSAAGASPGVRCVAWSLDGRALACGASDGSLRLWDTASGRTRSLVRDPLGSPVVALAWLPSLSRAAFPEYVGRRTRESGGNESSASSAEESSADDTTPAMLNYGALAVATEGGHVMRLSALRGDAVFFGVEGHSRVPCRDMAYATGGTHGVLIVLDQCGQVHTLDAGTLAPLSDVAAVALPQSVAATERMLYGAAPDFGAVLDYTALGLSVSTGRVVVLARPTGARLGASAESVRGTAVLMRWAGDALVDDGPPLAGAYCHARFRVGAAFCGSSASLLVLGGEGMSPFPAQQSVLTRRRPSPCSPLRHAARCAAH